MEIKLDSTAVFKQVFTVKLTALELLMLATDTGNVCANDLRNAIACDYAVRIPQDYNLSDIHYLMYSALDDAVRETFGL